MSCYDGTPQENELWYLRYEKKMLTHWLCWAVVMLTENRFPLPPELKIWWTTHQAIDRAREETERKKNAVLAKLTREEQEVLGIWNK